MKIRCLYSFSCASLAGKMNKGKGNSAGLAWESQVHCFGADRFLITHSWGTDTQHDYNSQGNCRPMLSIIIKLEFNK